MRFFKDSMTFSFNFQTKSNDFKHQAVNFYNFLTFFFVHLMYSMSAFYKNNYKGHTRTK